MMYVVESRRPSETSRTGWSDWRSDEIGENEPRSLEACEEACRVLPTLGPDWSAAEYRVVEAP